MKILVQDMSYVYRSPFFPAHKALSGISFEIRSGELVALVGASGSGKTTLMRHLNGLFKPTSGRVLIDEQDLADRKTDLSAVRKKVGLVFQFPESQLFEETVEKDVAFGVKNMKLSDPAVRKRVHDALQKVGLNPGKFGKCVPFHLSGGEKRRAAIAGILVMQPDVLILDEPTAGLDWRGTCQVESIMRAYHRSGRTVLFVSHDMDLVARLADRVLVLSDGRLIFDGKKDVLFRKGDILMDVELTLPYVVRYMRMLRRKGMAVRMDVFTVGEAKKEIRRVLKSPLKPPFYEKGK